MFRGLWAKVNQLMQNKTATDLGQKPNESQPFSNNLRTNIQAIKTLLENCYDITYREFEMGTEKPIKAVLVYIADLTDKNVLNDNVLRPLMLDCTNIIQETKLNKQRLSEQVKKHLVQIGTINDAYQISEAVDSVLKGSALLLFEGDNVGLVLSVGKWVERGVEEAKSETVVRGPREGFNENLTSNLALLRRRLKTPNFKTEKYTLGALTKTDTVIVYIDGIVNPKTVEEVRIRLQKVKIDGVLESGKIESLIADSAYSPFPLTLATERPDKVVAGLLEGQIGILVDTTPFALLLPITFYQFMQASEDSYTNYIFSSAIRLMRFFALNTALLLPSLYIAVVTYHQEMIPTPLLISIAAAREGVPFPAFLEAIIMEFTFEVLREAGVRLPRPVGQAVSIVGALVIGEAAVSAGLVSPAMVIIVSLTAIASFTIPSPQGSLPIRLLRFPMMVLAAILGLYGVMLGLMAILVHLCSLRSFGIPYLSPIAPTTLQDLKDVIVRFPWWAMDTRPKLIGKEEPIRNEPNLKPNTPPPRNKVEENKEGDESNA